MGAVGIATQFERRSGLRGRAYDDGSCPSLSAARTDRSISRRTEATTSLIIRILVLSVPPLRAITASWSDSVAIVPKPPWRNIRLADCAALAICPEMACSFPPDGKPSCSTSE